ncbi:MAG: L,D-transpeptidase family protein [Gordonia polyisoprenivorans]|nr:L,D-transpeptidase family protein [Gordonia polyisoprenivorans]
MNVSSPPPRPTHLSRRRLLTGGVAAVGAAALTGCGSSTAPRSLSSSASASSSAPAGAGVDVVFTPQPDTSGVDPLARVSVSVSAGTLSSVVMVNGEGREIPGILTPDRMSWKPGEPLGFDKTYTLTVVGRDPRGGEHRAVSTFTTLAPSNQTALSFTTTGGNTLNDESTYGIGLVVVAHFDEPIGDRAAAEKRLSVTTEPATQGAWMWVDDQNAHWRPQRYYEPGTRVQVTGSIYGVALGGGLYGQEDVQRSFTIGRSHISIADDRTKQVSVYDNGVLVRTMPTSMGMGGSEVVNGQTISFWTQRGVYTVLDKANPVIMDSSTFGLPINSRLGYRETIYYATRISTDGIYLHQLESSIWAQGNTNTSHGCLNLNPDNARWFYDFSIPGDVVEVRNTGGEPLTQAQNGDWSVPWTTWMAGSAL